jgi:hypothetical protein
MTFNQASMNVVMQEEINTSSCKIENKNAFAKNKNMWHLTL